jgi:hypothetical protein
MRKITFVAIGVMALSSPVAGQEIRPGDPCWCEGIDGDGDAGSLPDDAQIPDEGDEGARPFECILGQLSSTGPAEDFEDMYLIRVCPPAAGFVARTNFMPTTFNTQLFLFRIDERGRVANDDISPKINRSRITGVPDEGPPLMPGLYYLAVSGFPRSPESAGGPIFTFQTPFQQSGPDGPGGGAPITGWFSGMAPAVGEYRIGMSGVTFATGSAMDCNMNGVADVCDIAYGPSSDDNGDGIPDECQCRADVDDSGTVDTGDLVLLLASWGPCAPGQCPTDINFDRTVDTADLVLLLAAWGPC